MRTRRAVVKAFFWIALETIDFPIISTTTAVGRTGSTVMNESCETRLVAPIIRTRYIYFWVALNFY